jgi:iron complex outermembrane recepter protein
LDLPHSWMKDAGLFVEWSKPVGDRWTPTVGARVDYVDTSARESEYELAIPGLPVPPMDESDILYAFYLQNRYKLDDHWTVSADAGYSQRPPSLYERYAGGIILSSLQSGFTRVIGDPQLKPQRDWQLDFGLSVNQEHYRGKANVFYAWLPDYVTFRDSSVVLPTEFESTRLLDYINTPLATLAGFELFGEVDLWPRMSVFGKMSFVEGRDQTLDAPLPSIPPLDSTVGVRFHDCEKGRVWGVDMAARMVATQNRLGTIESQGVPTVVEERTPGFTVCYIQGYWNYTKNLHFIGGIDNVFNRLYLEHLDLRLNGPAGFPAPETFVWQPGFTPYVGVNWVF